MEHLETQQTIGRPMTQALNQLSPRKAIPHDQGNIRISHRLKQPTGTPLSHSKSNSNSFIDSHIENHIENMAMTISSQSESHTGTATTPSVVHEADGTVVSVFSDGTRVHSFPCGKTLKYDAALNKVSTLNNHSSITAATVNAIAANSSNKAKSNGIVNGNGHANVLESTLKVYSDGVKVQRNENSNWRYILHKKNGAKVQLSEEGALVKINKARWRKQFDCDGSFAILNPAGEPVQTGQEDKIAYDKLLAKYTSTCEKLLGLSNVSTHNNHDNNNSNDQNSSTPGQSLQSASNAHNNKECAQHSELVNQLFTKLVRCEQQLSKEQSEKEVKIKQLESNLALEKEKVSQLKTEIEENHKEVKTVKDKLKIVQGIGDKSELGLLRDRYSELLKFPDPEQIVDSLLVRLQRVTEQKNFAEDELLLLRSNNGKETASAVDKRRGSRLRSPFRFLGWKKKVAKRQRDRELSEYRHRIDTLTRQKDTLETQLRKQQLQVQQLIPTPTQQQQNTQPREISPML